MSKWLDNAIFYEIYPQSFKDSNADGIGDFQGIIENWITSMNLAVTPYGLIRALNHLSETPATTCQIIALQPPDTELTRI